MFDQSSFWQGFAVITVMIARVRPSLNGAREALKTWDEASVVWPRIEVWNDFIRLDMKVAEISHSPRVSVECYAHGRDETISSKAIGSQFGRGNFRSYLRMAICSSTKREKIKTKTVCHHLF